MLLKRTANQLDLIYHEANRIITGDGLEWRRNYVALKSFSQNTDGMPSKKDALNTNLFFSLRSFGLTPAFLSEQTES